MSTNIQSHLTEDEKNEHFKRYVQHEKPIEECFKVIVGRQDDKSVLQHCRSVNRMFHESAQSFEAAEEKSSSTFGKILRKIIEDEINSSDGDGNNIDNQRNENKSSNFIRRSTISAKQLFSPSL